MLIDTSGWFCLFDEKDFRHDKAQTYYDSAKQRLTHSYVVAEFVALNEARKKNRLGMLSFVSDLLTDSEIDIVWVDETLNLKALELLHFRADKSWSLCDAVSFVLMDNHRITEALTTDHNFEQAGFVQLLES